MSKPSLDEIKDFYHSVENYRTKGPWQLWTDKIHGPAGGPVIYGGRDGDLCGDVTDIDLAAAAPELHSFLGAALDIIANLTEEINKLEGN